ncbi:conserved hypothetical protein [uncultured delta proteobacterium]|uniref:TIGR04076 family protein n=1 Tax=uncultured delta proteobacterium TaxID=34034 RepID=A0A212J2C1_9DELT|nr:conserved hypothetical protein [uncultured delta proteobacterium]
MTTNCDCHCQCAAANRTIEIEVTESECPKMPKGSKMILDGPIINYERTTGPVCLTAVNAIYPWIIVTRFDVFTPDLDFDPAADCYHAVCPCGTVKYDIRKGKPC